MLHDLYEAKQEYNIFALCTETNEVSLYIGKINTITGSVHNVPCVHA